MPKYTKKDWKLLCEDLSGGNWRQDPFDCLNTKKIYKELKEISIENKHNYQEFHEVLERQTLCLLKAPLEDMPLYINPRDPYLRDPYLEMIVKWRLKIGK